MINKKSRYFLTNILLVTPMRSLAFKVSISRYLLCRHNKPLHVRLQLQKITRLASSSRSDTSTASNWSDRIQIAYEQGETDGILALALTAEATKNPHDSWPSPINLLNYTYQAAKSQSGPTASMLHAWLAACTVQKQHDYAWELWNDVFQNDYCPVRPDVVTHCLAYASQAGVATQFDNATQRMNIILENAIRVSKKQAGSKRRKAMAKARRKSRKQSTEHVEESVQQLLGTTDFRILHDTDDLLVVNKPAGVSCFHQKAASKRDISLEQALLHVNTPLSTLNPEARGVVHRLDRGTSGCLVLAKTERAHALLVTEFFCRRVSKEYKCLVESVPSVSSGTIATPVDGRPAQSRYHVDEVLGDVALITVETLTGRKHQVRFHCSQGLHCPILGDKLYGGDSSKTSLLSALGCLSSSERQEFFFLHASSLAIPCFGIKVEAPLPRIWQHVKNELSAPTGS